jgi:methyl-accepting chemotaxis protein
MLGLYLSVAASCLGIVLPTHGVYFQWAALIGTLYSLFIMGKIRSQLRRAAQACHACSQGDMEQRIILPHAVGDMRVLMDSANRLIDVADAYIRESSASASHAARGLFYRNILPSGLNGSWKHGAGQLNRASLQVRENLIRNVREAGNRLEASVMQTVLQLSSSSIQLVSTSDTLNGIAAKSSTEATALSASTNQTSSSMSTIAAAVEEMTAAVQEISKQVHYASMLSQEAAQEGEAVRSVIGNLVHSSEKIGEIAELINGIAAQVNLLALNATIEAARAGEAGRGFAVVAAEVKDLATRTSEATGQVELYIQQTREEVARTGDAIASILAKVGEVNQASGVIAAAVEEQSATTLEISSNLQRTSGAVQAFADSVDSIAQTSTRTKNAAEAMHESSSTIATASDTLKTEITTFIRSLDQVA